MTMINPQIRLGLWSQERINLHEAHIDKRDNRNTIFGNRRSKKLIKENKMIKI